MLSLNGTYWASIRNNDISKVKEIHGVFEEASNGFLKMITSLTNGAFWEWYKK